MFIGRERELDRLDRLYQTEIFQLPVIFGRRRVGKTSLIAQFTSSKPTIFFTAVEGSATLNLRNLSQAIYQLDHPDADPTLAPVFQEFQTAFEAIFERGRAARLVFVIDEFPYLAQCDPSVSSVLQMLIDRHRDTSHLFMILCGSSLSFMREQVLGEKSPLYGRRTAQFEIMPFDFFDAMRFVPRTDPADAVAYYGMVGGIPLYLNELDDTASLLENIERVMLDPTSLLFEEPTNLLKQEVRKAPLYNSIIAAIAEGKTTSNEIATTVGVPTSEATYYLKELQRIGLVRRVEPIVAVRRRSYYALTDNLFRFWYRFVLPNRPVIERGMTGRALARIAARLPEYLGPVFEQVCGDWLWRMNVDEGHELEFDDLGTWWGPNPATRTEEEIDIVCTTDGAPSLIAECKWKRDDVDAAVLRKLNERGGLIGADVRTERYLFARSGFSSECQDLARQTGAHLVTLSDMVG